MKKNKKIYCNKQIIKIIKKKIYNRYRYSSQQKKQMIVLKKYQHLLSLTKVKYYNQDFNKITQCNYQKQFKIKKVLTIAYRMN